MLITFMTFVKGGKVIQSIIGIDSCSIYFVLLTLCLILISFMVVITFKRNMLMND